MSALRLINETEITSSVSNLSVTDVFSADFDIYKITVAGWSNTTTQNVRLQFINSSGSVVTASNYDKACAEQLVWSSFGEIRATNTDHIGEICLSSSTSASGSATIYIFNPNLSSSYTFLLSQGTGELTGLGHINEKVIGVLKQTASMSGFKLFPVANNVNGGTIRTYGLRVDS